MTAESVDRRSVYSIYREYEKGILIAFSIVAFLLILILRTFRHLDLISFGASLAIAISWATVWFSREMTGRTSWGPIYEARLLPVRVLGVISLAALGSFFAISGSWYDVVFSGSQQKSTLTQPVLFVVPIFNDLQSVPIDFSTRVEDVSITTTDGVPLTCSAYVSSLVLDTSKPDELEHLLLSKSPDLVSAIAADVRSGIGEGMMTLLHRSSVEIADPRNSWAISYAIGSYVRSYYRFADDDIVWQNGTVDYDCKVKFNS